MRRHVYLRRIVAVLAVIAAAPWLAHAQEMEPRAYSPAPVGFNIASISLAQSSGGVAMDPTLPIENVDATINSATVGYMRTFALFGRTASAAVGLPYAWGDVTGDVYEERRTATRSGLADARVRLSVNLIGGEVGDRAQFAARTRSTQVGASVTVVAPTGEYDSSKLINLGSNRWSVKPEIGLYQPFGQWSFELAAGVWLFGDNDDFYGGVRREQDPISSVQTHFGYTFRPHLWATADWSYYRGGASRVDGVHKRDLQESTRAGLAVSIPVSARDSLKLAWSNGMTTRIGADFTTYTITLQRAW